MRENTDLKDSEYGHFSRSVNFTIAIKKVFCSIYHGDIILNNIIWIVTQNLHKLHYRQVVLISKFLTARIVFNYQAVFLTINILVTFWMLLWEFLMVDWKFWAPMRNIVLKTEFWLVIYVNYIQAAVKTLKTLEAAIGDVLWKKCSETFCKTNRKTLVLESLFQQNYKSQVCNISKKETSTQVFSSEFCEIFMNIYF